MKGVANNINLKLNVVEDKMFDCYTLDDNLCLKNKRVIVIGAFDGVHQGHQYLIAQAKQYAQLHNLELSCLTFSPNPSLYFNPDATQCMLMDTVSEVYDLLRLGIDNVFVYRFDKELSSMDATEFALTQMQDLLRADAIFVGADFRFGYKNQGDPALLKELGFNVFVEDLEMYGSEKISSTLTRSLLKAGDVKRATCLLGHYPYVKGKVVHGRGQGTSFGFPTANLVYSDLWCMPESGVYAGCVSDGDKIWPAAINIGHSPTFEDGTQKTNFLEANLIDCNKDLYGKELVCFLIAKISETKKFNSCENLELAVQSYINWVKDRIGSVAWEVE